MSIKHFVGLDGKYLGVFVDGALPDVAAVEVPERPDEFSEWNGAAWVEDLGAKKAHAVAGVKAEAGKRILARYPQYKQANMTARAVELAADNQKTGPEWTAIRAAWDWVKAVRAESNRIEAAVMAADTVAAVDAAVAGAAWPD
jgi:predicted house-cleaning NTP pyrophosphatase (Maf/HAM1 superfamily)